jgi:hypothetical protein
MKGLGLRAGVCDIIAVHAGRIFALELKAETGRASEAQLAFLADMERAGAATCSRTASMRRCGRLRPGGCCAGRCTKFALLTGVVGKSRQGVTPSVTRRGFWAVEPCWTKKIVNEFIFVFS